MTTRIDTITLHINPGEVAAFHWGPEEQIGYDARWPDCFDITRKRSLPSVNEVSELPWSPRQIENATTPLDRMTGVRFEPLDSLLLPKFLTPFYDWGIRAVWFGENTRSSRLNSGYYFEILFDSAESRQSFKDIFGDAIIVNRTGKNTEDPTNTFFIDRSSVYYSLTASDDERAIETELVLNSDVWGRQTLYMLSWKQPITEIEPTPPPPKTIKEIVDEKDILLQSEIVDIQFKEPLSEIVAGENIMGSCEDQEVDPCRPVVTPECVVGSDCRFCNSVCVNGVCTCEDCPCNSVCLDVIGAGTQFPSQGVHGPRELIGDDQENCVDCNHPIFGDMFCSCQPAASNGLCRPERDTEDGSNCDCPTSSAISKQVCCENQDENSSEFGVTRCCSIQEFPGNGTQVVRCISGYGCAFTECEIDAHCGNECEFCQLDENGIGTCTPKENTTPCGTDDPGCEHCIDGECVSTESDKCFCEYNECPPGHECCPEGHCCDEDAGGCNDSGCNECLIDGDCPECEICQQLEGGNRCTSTDCPSCFRREPPDCTCTIPVCRECEDCIQSDPLTHECVVNCPICSECDGNGICTEPPVCPSDEILNTETCECEARCLDCEVWNGTECEIFGCGCCTQCIEIPQAGGTSISECTSTDSSLCPAGQVCQEDPITGSCNCVIPGCDPPCETIGGGCMTCIVPEGQAVGFCSPPQFVPPELGGPLPDACNDTCEQCQTSGDCGDTTCDGDCCLDASCCPPGNKCCNDFDPIYCCGENEVCCGDNGCCPEGQTCCTDPSDGSQTCCDPTLCETCVPGVGCVVCAGEQCATCVNGSCIGGCAECENCIDGNCVPDENRQCDPLCEINWCDVASCTPHPSCVTECICPQNGNPNQCTCNTGFGGLGATMNCDCGDEGGGGGQRGACCNLFTGACTQKTQQACADAFGAWQGPGVPCLPNPCQRIGTGVG